MTDANSAAAVISAIAALIAAIGSFAGVGLAIWNNRKIEQVHIATNSMKDELVAEVRTASLAKGLKQGREENR